jgi:hypothetical protein
MPSSALEQGLALTTGTVLGFVLTVFLGSVASSSEIMPPPAYEPEQQLLDEEFESWDRDQTEQRLLDEALASWERAELKK